MAASQTIITVGCKYPHGLRIFEEKPVKVVREMRGGSREVTEWHKTGKFVDLKGTAYHVDQPRPILSPDGYAVTTGVDAEFFNAWMEAHKNDDFVTSGAIAKIDQNSRVEGAARDMRGQKTGFEPIDPKNLPPEFSGKVETAEV